MKKIQDLYNEAVARLLPVWSARRALEKAREDIVSPLRKEIQDKVEPIESQLKEALSKESELKFLISDYYERTMQEQKQAHTIALEAQKAGDMETVRKATMDSFEASLKLNKYIFFREQDTAPEVVDFDKIPKEFLTLNIKAVHEFYYVNPDKEIPGLKRKTKYVVVVKEQK